MVCYNYNQTQNTQTQQYNIQRPGLAVAAAYKHKNNFAECGNNLNGDNQCCNVQNNPDGADGNNPCTTRNGSPGTCFNGNCSRLIPKF